MSKPIIDPSTLTEEQILEIRKEYNLNIELENRSNGDVEKHWYSGHNLTLLWLFGKELFTGKEVSNGM